MTSIDSLPAPVPADPFPAARSGGREDDTGFAEHLRRAEDERSARDAAASERPEKAERSARPERDDRRTDDRGETRRTGRRAPSREERGAPPVDAGDRRRAVRQADDPSARDAAAAPAENGAAVPSAGEPPPSAAAFADADAAGPNLTIATTEATASPDGATGAAPEIPVPAAAPSVAAADPAGDPANAEPVTPNASSAPNAGTRVEGEEAAAPEDGTASPATAGETATPETPQTPAPAAMIAAVPAAPADAGDAAANDAAPASDEAAPADEKTKLRNARAATPAAAALAHAAANSAAVAPTLAPTDGTATQPGTGGDAAAPDGIEAAGIDGGATPGAPDAPDGIDDAEPADGAATTQNGPDPAKAHRAAAPDPATAMPRNADPAATAGSGDSGTAASAGAPPPPNANGHPMAAGAASPPGDLRPATQGVPQMAESAGRAPAPPAEQLAVEIGRAVRDGRDRFSLELRPGDLGRISVDLQVGDDRRVTAVVHVDRPDTLQLLQRDSQALERALQNAGLRADMGSLSFNLRGEGGSQQQAFAEGGGPSRGIALRVPAAAAEAAAQLARPWRLEASGIDIRV